MRRVHFARARQRALTDQFARARQQALKPIFLRSLLCAVVVACVVTPVARADDAVVQQVPPPAPAPAAPATTPAQPAPVVQPVQPTAPAGGSHTEGPVVQQTNVTTTEKDEGPGVFKHGFQGLLAGALVGGSAGYLVGRRDGWKRSDWRAVGLGLGIGSLAGAAFGISVGFADRPESPGARYITRDMLAGSAFGGVVGVIGGGISAAVQNKAEHALFGATIGVLAGAGLGIITGIVEGQTRESKSTRVTTGRLQLRPDLMVTRAANGSNALTPGIAGRF